MLVLVLWTQYKITNSCETNIVVYTFIIKSNVLVYCRLIYTEVLVSKMFISWFMDGRYWVYFKFIALDISLFISF